MGKEPGADDLWKLATSELFRSNADRKHPFRNFVFGTLGLDKKTPEVRTVVKRKTLKSLNTIFFTDRRSPKVTQVRQSDQVSALFYHPKKMLQVRIYGTAIILADSDPRAISLLNDARQLKSIQDYMTKAAPGTPLIGDIEYSDQLHFAVIEIIPDQIEVLQLSSDGHQRFLFHQSNHGWTGRAIVP